jgi:tetratricopeptide (TPR) repeat protein
VLAQYKLKGGGQPRFAQKLEIIGNLLVGKSDKGMTIRIPVADLLEAPLYNWTNEEKYRLDSEGIKPGAKEPEERYKLALWCLEKGMLPEAREELKKAIELRKDYLDAILLLAQVHMDASDWESALSVFRAGLDAGAPAGELWYEIGRCLRILSFTEGALVAFEKSAEAQPRLHRAKLALARTLTDSGNAQAGADGATDFFTKLGNSPDTTPAHKAEAYLVRGLALVRLGQLDKARADFAECLKLDPASAEALNGNGAALALQGQFPQAGPEFVKAIRANQYLTEAWTNLATLFLLGGKWAEADQLSAAAAQRDAASVEALLGRGLSQLMTGGKDAAKQIEAAAKMEPASLQVLMVTGLLSLREGQDDAALERFTGALRREYFYLPSYSGAAAAYLRAGRKLGAMKDESSLRKADEMRINAETLLRSVQDFDRTRPGVLAALGCAYAGMQRPDEARKALSAAWALSPKDPLLLYGQGYLDYYYGDPDPQARLPNARARFEEAVKMEAPPTDDFSKNVIADCKAAVEAIDQWLSTQLRFAEEFNGPDAKNIGNNWLQRMGAGITVSRAAGRARFMGKQAVKDFALTSLMRDIPGAEFFSIEITFYPEKVDKAEFGLSIFHTQQGTMHSGFSVGIDANGKARYHMNSSDSDLDRQDMVTGWTEIKPAIPNPKEITIRVTMTELKNRARAFTVFFRDPAKDDWVAVSPPVTTNPPRGTWQVGAWVHTWANHEVLLYVDNIKVLDQSRR